MMNKNLLTNLPEDVFITNILLSKVLPIKSLLSLKCVCKYLHNLIVSPAFVNMQISKQNNNNNPLVLIKATHRHNVFFSLKFNGDEPCRPDEVVEFVSPIECTDIWGSCNGLVCLSQGKNAKTIVCLWNPLTKEYKILPPPLPLSTEILTEFGTEILKDKFGPVVCVSYGFGYDGLLDDYKIIRCSESFVVRLDDDDDGRRYIHIPITEFQVYTLGTNTWKRISNDNNPYKSYFVLSLPLSVVFVNGAVHWIMSTASWLGARKALERAEAKIVSFNIEKEVFREIQRPSMTKFKPDLCVRPEIQVLRGCLCALELDSSNQTTCNVWMMMDYGVKGSWTKLFTIVLNEVFRLWRSPACYKLLRFCGNGTEILMGSYNKILVYDMINNKARCVEFGEKIGKCRYQSEIYIESLVSLNSGVYKGAEGRIVSKRRRRRSKKKRVIEQAQLVKDFGSINLD